MTKFAQNFTRLITGRTFTLKELQSLIGLLNYMYVCLMVVPGRTFLRRIIILTCLLSNPSHFIRFNCARESRADLQMWSLFIGHYNGRSVILPGLFSSSDKELLFTDASGSIGFARFFWHRVVCLRLGFNARVRSPSDCQQRIVPNCV